MSEIDPQSRISDSAGPFGFTRREIIALVAIMVVSMAYITYDSLSERPSDTAPAWAIDDIVLNPDEYTTGESHAGSTRDSSRPSRRELNPEIIDINNADLQELARLPGIGPTLARRIIDDREKEGPFQNLNDLKRVNGIGPKKAAMLAGWVAFGPSAQIAIDSADAP